MKTIPYPIFSVSPSAPATACLLQERNSKLTSQRHTAKKKIEKEKKGILGDEKKKGRPSACCLTDLSKHRVQTLNDWFGFSPLPRLVLFSYYISLGHEEPAMRRDSSHSYSRVYKDLQ